MWSWCFFFFNAPAPTGVSTLSLHAALPISREFLRQLMDSVKAYHGAGLAHGDLSEYNVLNVREQPCIIDVGQAVPRQHPRFAELHERDIGNIHRWFRKRLPGLTREEVEQWST